MAQLSYSITLDGAGAGSTTVGVITGLVTAISASKNGQTANPAVVFSKQNGVGETILSVTVSANTVYHPEYQVQTNAGVNTGIYSKYAIIGDRIGISVTGGDASGVVSGVIEVLE